MIILFSMNYQEAIQLHPKKWCPFCHIKKDEIIKEYSRFFVIPSRAPYCEDHLLIIPKEHDILLHEMPHERHIQMYKIVDERTEKLHRYHKDVTLMLRDGKVGGTTGKSQNHIHFHLIPDYDI
ncbi:MAG: HIT domain-containing protein [bacterium]|nr:HIT domain-containing protein [bacterium]